MEASRAADGGILEPELTEFFCRILKASYPPTCPRQLELTVSHSIRFEAFTKIMHDTPTETFGTIPTNVAPHPLREAVIHHLRYTLGKDEFTRGPVDFYLALVHALRDRVLDAWLRSRQDAQSRNAKWVNYLSAEYLIGRPIDLVLDNLELREDARTALAHFGQDLDEAVAVEWDAGLGAGGLGRLAACYMESMATLGLTACGYGIRYEYGGFTQKIVGGGQIESADNWLRYGNPWEVPRRDRLYSVRFGGRVVSNADGRPSSPAQWTDTDDVMAMAYDLPIPGYRGRSVNTLRLWSAKATREFDFPLFSTGDYLHAVERKDRTEDLCRVLYPRDDVHGGRELRFKQEYFLVSASIQDVLRRYKRRHLDFDQFNSQVAVQINDTHPAMGIPELMRLLIDEEGVEWDRAWEMCVGVFGFTNHTLMPEALERWPVALVERLLPRHLQIIYEINERHLSVIRGALVRNDAKIARMSLIEEGPEKQVRMAELAVVGSHAVNGVSALHSNLLVSGLFRGFNACFPGRFSNKTNGISPRVWLKSINPSLAELISLMIGDGWITRLEELKRLAPLAEDTGFRSDWAAVKRSNKVQLAEYARRELSIALDPDSLFDCQVKRIHEYKRQLLKILHVITLYNRIRNSQPTGIPRTVVFSGKAAPGYAIAKLIIRLIHAVAETINADPRIDGLLRVVFMPNYGVTLAGRIVPACDLSEQISTAGTEASGTGNMKLALNGALTIGTLDGANLEIRDAVGQENFFAFGLTLGEVGRLRERGYSPSGYCERDAELAVTLEMIRDGYFSAGDRGLFQPLVDSLLRLNDPFMVLADFTDYVACQDRVEVARADEENWVRKTILNVARMGWCSSDRAIGEYAREVWGTSSTATGVSSGEHDLWGHIGIVRDTGNALFQQSFRGQ